MWAVWAANIGDRRHDLSRQPPAIATLVSRHVVGDHPEKRGQCAGPATGFGAAQLQDGLELAAQVPSRHGASGAGPPDGSRGVDETLLGGLEEGVRGRQTESKVLLAVAAQENGAGIGRVRMRSIPDASARSLMAFVQDSIEPAATVHTDGWLGYEPLRKHGYRHQVTFLRGRAESASELLPRVHRVVSLLKRWLLGTHQGGVSPQHLDYYLDEFNFRFNRRHSPSLGKLFYRLVQQAVAIAPAPYKSLVGGSNKDDF